MILRGFYFLNDNEFQVFGGWPDQNLLNESLCFGDRSHMRRASSRRLLAELSRQQCMMCVWAFVEQIFHPSN